MKIPTVKVPKFTTTLPVSGEKIEFRPFLVKEEKLLLLASESTDTDSAVNAISDIVESCTDGKVKSSEYCLADIQWMFLQIRSKSIGDEINLYLICGKCNHKHLKTLTINDFEVRLVEEKAKVINIDGSVRVELKYPTIHHYNHLFETSDDGAVYDVVADCITKIYNDDEVFRLNLSHDNMVNFYKTNFLLMQIHKYSLTEIENMMPWERETYIGMLLQYLEKKNNEQ